MRILKKSTQIPAITKDEKEVNRPHQPCLFCVFLLFKCSLLREAFSDHSILFFTRASYFLHNTHTYLAVVLLFLYVTVSRTRSGTSSALSLLHSLQSAQ